MNKHATQQSRGASKHCGNQACTWQPHKKQTHTRQKVAAAPAGCWNGRRGPAPPRLVVRSAALVARPRAGGLLRRVCRHTLWAAPVGVCCQLLLGRLEALGVVPAHSTARTAGADAPVLRAWHSPRVRRSATGQACCGARRAHKHAARAPAAAPAALLLQPARTTPGSCHT